MRSKTSCFNPTIIRKNLTRFAPVWGVYTLCLVVGILLMYTNGGTMKHYRFAYHMTQLVEIMAVVNLLYAPVVAQLLFGDLYNSRMCNMLHAFPLRRESWFLSHVVSGLAFSLIPTLTMALLSTPLLTGSLFENAVSLSWRIFLASNLQYLCFFGMAVFCVMVVGNRFTMLAAYGLLNAGPFIAYWLIDTVYTPMLYGVITPERLRNHLTPVYHMTNQAYIRTSASLYDLREIFGQELKGAVATFTVTDQWWRLWMLAGVGLAFALLGLLLYRIRDLECAGSAVAFPILRPVFQVLCAIFVAAAAQFFLYNFLGIARRNFLILTVGLVVGWFIGKMLTEHTTRVFNLKNCYGLAALAAVFAVSLWLTHVDILGIETRLPNPQTVKSVTFSGHVFEDPADIENFLRLNADALEHRAENSGTYVLVDGEWIYYIDSNADRIDEENPDNQFTYVDSVSLTYELEKGKQIRRRYFVWMDTQYVSSEAGRIARDYLNRWDVVNDRTVMVNGVEHNRLELILQDVQGIYVDFLEERQPISELDARSLVTAIQADCAEGNMAQSFFYHTGHFQVENEHAELGYHHLESIGITLTDSQYSWWVNVYADSRHTVAWLQSRGYLNAQVLPENIRF